MNFAKKAMVFFSAEQGNNKLNLDKFSELVFAFYGESKLEPFSSWTNALLYIEEHQKEKMLLSEFQHLIDHRLKNSNLFIVLCGSYMGFMEKEVLGAKSPLFGRWTGQLHMKTFDYQTSVKFMDGFTQETKLKLYGAFGGTPMYLQQIQSKQSFEEPLLLLRQEVLEELKKKADVFRKKRRRTWYVLFSKSGFSESVIKEAQKDESILLVGLDEIMRKEVSAVL